MHNRRIAILFAAALAAFALVEIHLFYLQIVHGADYQSQADRQRVALLPLDVARARILARDGSVLAQDRLAYDLAVVIGRLDPPNERAIRDPLRRLFYVGRGEKLVHILNTRLTIRPAPSTSSRSILAFAIIETDNKNPDLRVVERQVEFPVPDRILRAIDRLAPLAGQSSDLLLDRILHAALDVAALRTDVFAPVPIAQDVSYDLIAAVETQPDFFRGFQIESRFARTYPAGPLAPHTLGYVSAFNDADLGDAIQRYPGWPGRAYLMTLRAGRTGIEKSMDELLRGEFGMQSIERDNLGRQQQLLAEAPATAGRDVVLTLDPRLQKIAQNALRGLTGAAVFIDIPTGQILAMVSQPDFDPARIREQYAELARNPDHPFLDRTVNGAYPPGSVFKVVTALAALRQNTVPTSVTCTGSLRYGNRRFACNAASGHGTLALQDGLRYSCNVFFFQTAIQTGAEPLLDAARLLGLGRPTELQLPGERSGLVPDRADGGELLNIAIGQGQLLATPLQVAQLYATIANDGTLVPPRIILELRPFDSAGSPAAEMIPDGRPPVPLGLSQQALDTVRAGLYKVVNEPGGTAYRPFTGFNRPFRVAGKTSTAQRSNGNIGGFAGYAPADRPRVAFAIVVEHLTTSQGGGGTAAPIARRIFDAIPLDLLGLGPGQKGGTP